MMLPMPTFEMTGGCSSCKVPPAAASSDPGLHSMQRNATDRVFPQDKAARVLERDVLHPSQTFGPVALLDLVAELVLLLLRTDLRERDGDVLRKLQRGSMERTRVGF